MKANQKKPRRGDGWIRQRGNRWWFGYWDKRTGKKVEAPGGDTETEAVNALRDRLAQVRTGQFIPKGDRLTVNDLLDALVVHLAMKGARSTSHGHHIAVIRQHFGVDRAIDVTGDRLERFQREELAGRDGHTGKQPATVNRELGVLRQAYRLAVKQRRLLPQMVPYISMLPERNARQGFFERDEFERVVAHLSPGLADMARFAYATGWRRGEIVGLRWQHVDREAREVRLETSKNGEGRLLCYGDDLAELIEIRWAAREYEGPNQETVLSPLVFHDKGRPIGDTRKQWMSAFEAAGVPVKLFHDLRRTAVRNMIRAGVPQSVAMTISGHKTVSMFLRYKITSGDEQRDALQKVRVHLNGSPGPARKVVNLRQPVENFDKTSTNAPPEAPRGQRHRR